MIIQGDNGTRLRLHISENNEPLPLDGATIDVVIKAGKRKFTKIAQITGRGEAEVELTSEDLATVGLYYTQATVKFNDESVYSSDVQRFMVGAKI